MMRNARKAGGSGRKALACTAAALALTSLAGALRAAPAVDDWARIENSHFTLHGKPWVVKGVNYIGSWRHKMTIEVGKGVEHFTIWALYHDFDEAAVAADFEVLRTQLNTTAVRMAAPTRSDFEDLVRYHHYDPWYSEDGSITETYRKELVVLADAAHAHGLRIQFCLLWNIGNEIAKEPEAFEAGGRLDKFYSAQVRSAAAALADHPGAFAFSVGNETLVRWPVNGQHRSSYESVAANFLARRIADLRAMAPKQLVTDEEVMANEGNRWYSPGAEFADLLTAEKSAPQKRMVDIVDYLGPHFYPSQLAEGDSAARFDAKIASAKRNLALYMKSANAAGKPVVLDEIGLKVDTRIVVQGESHYGQYRDSFIQSLLQEAKTDGVSGVLAWDAIPLFKVTADQSALKLHDPKDGSPIELDVAFGPADDRKILFFTPVFNVLLFDKFGALHSTPAAASLKSF